MRKLKLKDDLEHSPSAVGPYPIARHDMFAKKDHVIHQNEHHIEIKKGDDVSEIPEHFHENLKTEGVI